MQECFGPVIILIVVGSQIWTAIKKAQEQARRQAGGLPHPAPPARRAQVPEFEPPRSPTPEDILRDVLNLPPFHQTPAPSPQPAPPRRAPPAEAARTTVAPLPAASRPQRRLRVGRRSLRQAVLMSEILAPPVALRD